jgi:hypothetical protein
VTHAKRVAIEGLSTGMLGLLLLAMLISHAASQDTPAGYTSVVTVEYEVPDVPKLEAKAVEILRRVGTVTGEFVTLAQARAITRPGGVVDVARCWEIVSTDRLRGVVQARVTGVRVTGEHP